jgi:hypothetical protein
VHTLGSLTYHHAVITGDGAIRGKMARVLVTLLVAVLLSAVGWLAYSWFTYQALALPDSEPPSQLHYCGRDFGEGYHTAALPHEGWTYAPAFTLWPAGWKVYTMKPGKSSTTTPQVNPPLPCTMGLVLRESDHAYVSYGLVGGP